MGNWTPAYQGRPPQDLLGDLNDVEDVNAPTTLFVKGDVNLLRDTIRVAMVGSRNPSADGAHRAARLARELVENGVVVVSGLARGIDSVAHRTAIEAHGRTIAVLGTPLDRVYPAENAELQALIGRDHLLVSQFPPGHPIQKANFPRRNRVMALIAHGSVIIEAGDSSGTLSQGWEALRLGRPLFILQSVLDRSDLSWPAQMVNYGAMPLAEVEGLLEWLPIGGGPVPAAAF